MGEIFGSMQWQCFGCLIQKLTVRKKTTLIYTTKCTVAEILRQQNPLLLWWFHLHTEFKNLRNVSWKLQWENAVHGPSFLRVDLRSPLLQKWRYMNKIGPTLLYFMRIFMHYKVNVNTRGRGGRVQNRILLDHRITCLWIP